MDAAGMQVHFTLHGCHHKFPMDKGRLVFPPLPAAACAAGLLAAAKAMLPEVHPITTATLLLHSIASLFDMAMHPGNGC